MAFFLFGFFCLFNEKVKEEEKEKRRKVFKFFFFFKFYFLWKSLGNPEVLDFFFFNNFFLRENPYESNWYFDKFWKFNFGINSVILVRVSLSVIDV